MKIKKLFYSSWIVLVTLLCVCNTTVTSAASSYSISQDDLNSIVGSTPFFDPNAQQCGANGSASVTLTGNDNEQKAWNFFTGEGLSAAATAGIMGNIMQESGFNPLEVQGGGTSDDPATAGNNGWGIVQWSPGAKVETIAQAVGIDPSQSSVDQLGTQLQIIWAEINGKDPSEQPNILPGLQAITGNSAQAASQAASFFVNNFEHGTDPGGIRESYAEQFLQKYAGTTGTSTSTTSSTSNCSTNTTSDVSCTAGGASATGLAKIYCEALRFNHLASYSESDIGNHLPGGNPQWIQQVCPAAGNPNGKITSSCYVDCSGLVNISVYLAFGYNLEGNTYTEIAQSSPSANPQLWRQIPVSQVQEGDLIQPAAYDGDHVEIIQDVVDGTVYTMGAHTSTGPQDDEVDTASYPEAPGNVYLQWIGPTGGGTTVD